MEYTEDPECCWFSNCGAPAMFSIAVAELVFDGNGEAVMAVDDRVSVCAKHGEEIR